ncbi:hypothetical protein L208DRAFT_1376882 [Tricholoma matsutake]|nr:hypothetical protein L208DRAFT_1376882 [Tricholoma matsutake 945]
MFSFIGLRFGARIISPTLSTRSFLTTSRLALATTGTAKKSVAKVTHTASKKKSTSEKRVTAKKKTPTKKKTLTKKKTPLKKKASVKPKRVIIPVTTARKPKRSASGYGLYVQKHITDVSPTTKSMQEIFKDAAVNWRTLPEHEKQQYSEDAASLREQRAKESLKWFDSIDPRILKEINRRRVARGKSRFRKPKDPNAPKINRNPFLLTISSFLSDLRKSDEVAGFSIAAIGRLGGERWRDMSSSQKQAYPDKANATGH